MGQKKNAHMIPELLILYFMVNFLESLFCKIDKHFDRIINYFIENSKVKRASYEIVS